MLTPPLPSREMGSGGLLYILYMCPLLWGGWEGTSGEGRGGSDVSPVHYFVLHIISQSLSWNWRPWLVLATP